LPSIMFAHKDTEPQNFWASCCHNLFMHPFS
jgi:hypothetical protein